MEKKRYSWPTPWGAFLIGVLWKLTRRRRHGVHLGGEPKKQRWGREEVTQEGNKAHKGKLMS
jgi:hypothetical protein